MFKILALGSTSLLGLVLSAFLAPPDREGPPPPPAKKKGPEAKAAGDLRKAYDALRKVRRDEVGGRAEERLGDWADRAADLYRKGIDAMEDGDERLAHEYGTMAHDLARAVDHATNAARLDRRDDDLPPPPGAGPEAGRERVVRDLQHAYDRIRKLLDEEPSREGRFYLDAARDLYQAARRDAEGGRYDRAGELARAAEAMSHVPEHLAHAERGPDGPPPPDRKKEDRKKEDRKKEDHRPGPRGEREGDLPPPIR